MVTVTKVGKVEKKDEHSVMGVANVCVGVWGGMPGHKEIKMGEGALRKGGKVNEINHVFKWCLLVKLKNKRMGIRNGAWLKGRVGSKNEEKRGYYDRIKWIRKEMEVKRKKKLTNE